MRKLLSVLLCLNLVIGAYGQRNDLNYNESEFNSVFKDLNTGHFKGTVNGVLFIQNTSGSDIILDFQGSNATLNLETDNDSVYDVSYKHYEGYTTSGKTKINYNTYATANSLSISLPSGVFQAGLIDGACDMVIKGITYYYKAEKDTEYLVLQVNEEISLTNYYDLLKSIDYDISRIEKIEAKEQFIKLLPNSVLVFAITRKS